MLKKLLMIVLGCVMFLTTSCASIVSKSTYNVCVDSDPTGAKFTIRNRSNRIITTGTTPTTVSLDADNGYFRREKYQINFEKDGYRSATGRLNATLDGWYLGNVFWGVFGLAGFLIVDPATGAMWRMPRSVTYQLFPVEETK